MDFSQEPKTGKRKIEVEDGEGSHPNVLQSSRRKRALQKKNLINNELQEENHDEREKSEEREESEVSEESEGSEGSENKTRIFDGNHESETHREDGHIPQDHINRGEKIHSNEEMLHGDMQGRQEIPIPVPTQKQWKCDNCFKTDVKSMFICSRCGVVFSACGRCFFYKCPTCNNPLVPFVYDLVQAVVNK